MRAQEQPPHTRPHARAGLACAMNSMRTVARPPDTCLLDNVLRAEPTLEGSCAVARFPSVARLTAHYMRHHPRNRRQALWPHDVTADPRTEAAATVASARVLGSRGLAVSHTEWWHTFWPASFLSIPVTRVEGFYWVEM